LHARRQPTSEAFDEPICALVSGQGTAAAGRVPKAAEVSRIEELSDFAAPAGASRLHIGRPLSAFSDKASEFSGLEEFLHLVAGRTFGA
jgi:hypothetical protein